MCIYNIHITVERCKCVDPESGEQIEGYQFEAAIQESTNRNCGTPNSGPYFFSYFSPIATPHKLHCYASRTLTLIAPHAARTGTETDTSNKLKLFFSQKSVVKIAVDAKLPCLYCACGIFEASRVLNILF